MRGRYFSIPGQISNRPRHAQDTLVRTCRQVEALCRTFEQRPALLIDLAYGGKLLSLQPGISHARALDLLAPYMSDTCRHCGAVLAVRVTVAKHLGRRPHYLDMQVDAIQQRS